VRSLIKSRYSIQTGVTSNLDDKVDIKSPIFVTVCGLFCFFLCRTLYRYMQADWCDKKVGYALSLCLDLKYFVENRQQLYKKHAYLQWNGNRKSRDLSNHDTIDNICKSCTCKLSKCLHSRYADKLNLYASYFYCYVQIAQGHCSQVSA